MSADPVAMRMVRELSRIKHFDMEVVEGCYDAVTQNFGVKPTCERSETIDAVKGALVHLGYEFDPKEKMVV
jgi:hypothetical protein